MLIPDWGSKHCHDTFTISGAGPQLTEVGEVVSGAPLIYESWESCQSFNVEIYYISLICGGHQFKKKFTFVNSYY